MKAARHSAVRCVTGARLAALAGAAIGVGVVALWGGYAAAAGTGPYGSPGPEGVPPGSFSVLTSQTVPKTGGTVTATHDGQKVFVVVPATDFKTKVQVTIFVPTLSSITNAVAAFEVSFAVGGTAVTGTFTKPVVLTITASSIKSGDVVEEWESTGWASYTHATVSNGTARITVTSDPTFAVDTVDSTATTTTPTTAPSDTTSATVTATSAETGIPVMGVTLGSGGLLAGGGVSLLVARRRRQSASRP